MDTQHPSEGTPMLCHKMQAISEECWVYFFIGSCLAFLLGALSEMKTALLMIFLFGVLAGLVMNGEIRERTDRNLAEQASPEVGKQKKPLISSLASSSATHIGTLGQVLENGTSAENGKSPILLTIRGEILKSLGTGNATIAPPPQDPKSDSNGDFGSSKHRQASRAPIHTGLEAVAPPTAVHPGPESPNSAISLGTQTRPGSSGRLSQNSLAMAPNSTAHSLFAEPRTLSKRTRVLRAIKLRRSVVRNLAAWMQSLGEFNDVCRKPLSIVMSRTLSLFQPRPTKSWCHE
ncbi:MAG: hypothetical protein LQ349_005184 [Xanthoria aureola]|nr:MAG: hypothetical protein LQ349_005184 [Xanthoria aureola]